MDIIFLRFTDSMTFGVIFTFSEIWVSEIKVKVSTKIYGADTCTCIFENEERFLH